MRLVVLSVVVILEPQLHPARISAPHRVTIRREKISALLALQHQAHAQHSAQIARRVQALHLQAAAGANINSSLSLS
jgi:hypothetical protein